MRHSLRSPDAWRAERAWCLRVNRLCMRSDLRRMFALASRLGDGAFWYALMAAMVVCDGLDGLRASVHLALTGAVSLLLYKAIKRATYHQDDRIVAGRDGACIQVVLCPLSVVRRRAQEARNVKRKT